MANAEGRGYYRTEYGDGGDKAIARAGAVDLTAAERIVLLSDEWGLVALDHQTIPGYLDMVAALGVERSEPVTEVAWNPLEGVGEEIVADQDRPRYQAWVRRLLAPQLAALAARFAPATPMPCESSAPESSISSPSWGTTPTPSHSSSGWLTPT